MRFCLLLALLLCWGTAFAQPDTLAVSIQGEDGHRLHASYYPAVGENAPAVLLLHQLYTTRSSWQRLIPQLQAHGYAVLTPDLRGYGQTGGDIDWRMAQSDTRLWLNWLRAQTGVRGDRLSVMGSSMGANLAVIGCADDVSAQPSTGCVAAVALSPGQNYFGYTPLAPALDALASRPVLMIAAERDSYPARAVRNLAPAAPGVVDVIWLPGNAHGLDLLSEATTVQVLAWLDAHAR